MVFVPFIPCLWMIGVIMGPVTQFLKKFPIPDVFLWHPPKPWPTPTNAMSPAFQSAVGDVWRLAGMTNGMSPEWASAFKAAVYDNGDQFHGTRYSFYSSDCNCIITKRAEPFGTKMSTTSTVAAAAEAVKLDKAMQETPAPTTLRMMTQADTITSEGSIQEPPAPTTFVTLMTSKTFTS